MSEKRKFDDLLDPDYPQNAKLLKTSADQQQPPLTREERIFRVRNIVKREFQRELAAKEQAVLEIDNRITLAKKLLLRVKYAVVSNYYNKKGLELPDAQAQECVDSLNLDSTAPPPAERDQRAVHPALKSILGKKTVDFDEILKARPTREAAKTAKTSIKEKLRTKKEEKRLQRAMNGGLNKVICHDPMQQVLPRHVEPNKVEKDIHQLNAARGGNQTKHLIAVGNTSKYVGDDKHAHGVTHKWLVYVKTKTQTPIERIVNKVRFFLHPSYRPNDIVDVSEPPFQLSRRGWGEFPIRLQLFFDPSLQQKPVQLMHNLVLDKSLTGLQTMGAETLVEIWLRSDHIQSTDHENQKNNQTASDFQPENEENSQNSDDLNDHIDDKLMEFLTRIENQTSESLCEEGERIEPTINVPTRIAETNAMIDPSVCLELENKRSDEDEIMNFNAGKINELHNWNKVDNQIKQEMDQDSMEAADFHGFITETKNDMTSSTQAKSTTLTSNNEKTIANGAQRTSQQLLECKMQPKTGQQIQFPSTFIVGEAQIASKVNNTAPNQSSLQVKLSHLPIKSEPASIAAKTTQSINAIQLVDKTGKPPAIITTVGSTQNQPIIFQRRLVKCIDKQGNVKYMQMLVKRATPPTDRPNIVPASANVAQKAVFITKTNGHAQNNQIKPVILKVAPTGTLNLVKPTHVINTPNAAVQQSNHLPPENVVKVSVPATVHPQMHLLKLSTSKENNSNLSQPKCTQNSTNKNQVLVKNGKMYIKDPLQTKIKQQTRKQESLLKPQVSLLKPIVKNDNLSNCIRNDAKGVFRHTAIATDHDYTSLIGMCPVANRVTIHRPVSSQPQQAILSRHKSSIVTVNSPNNSRINVIVTKLDDDEDVDERNSYRSDNREGMERCRLRDETDIRLTLRGSGVPKSTALMQKPRRDYDGELKAAFSRSDFVNVRQGVEFLLQRLPLINAQASSFDYSLSFPFVVKNQNLFERLTTPKLRSNEWLRAKYIQRLLQKHPCIDKTKIWTTKETILFARLHAYTPVIKYKFGKEIDDDKNCAMDGTLKDFVKKEINREKYDIQTLTLVHETYDWINEARQKIKAELQANEDIIDVDGIDGENVINTASQHQQSPFKNVAGKYFYSLDKSLEQESSFVSDVCQQIGIQLKPEEIVNDVLHPSTHLVLVQCLKSFINDLMRRAAAGRPDTDVASPRIETPIQPDDIKNAILHRPQWDFLTNNGLGVARPKEQKQ